MRSKGRALADRERHPGALRLVAQSPYNSYRVGKRMIHRRDSSPAENVTRHPGAVTITKFWIPDSATADSKRLVGTRALRGFADGAVSILLPSYLTALGLSGIQI